MITFRRLQQEDLTLLQVWLNRDFVSEWYTQPDTSIKGLGKKYLPYIRGEDKRTRHYIIMSGERPCGMIQWYHLSDWPEFKNSIRAEDNSISIDLFIGEKDLIHKGLGAGIIKQFLHEVAFPASNADSCYIGPEERNKAAIRCYQKAGFEPIEVLDVPGDPGLSLILKLNREKL